MFSVLLAIIYISFISLGLPDSLLGSVWPIMSSELSAPLSAMGIISIIISLGTVISSLLSDRLTRRLGTGLVTAISVFATAVGLLGFSIGNSFWILCLFAIPYGLGAGAVDAALNNYVALHYSSRHMSWLHCFWGVGASVGPYIMSFAIALGKGWRGGYGIISVMQIALSLLLFFTLPIWRARGKGNEKIEVEASESLPVGIKEVLKIKGVKSILVAFFCYCAIESTAGLWASSYLVDFKGVDKNTATAFASFFYLGITLGRFISGFVADRFGDRRMIRIGTGVLIAGAVLIAIPVSLPIFSLIGLVILGFGAAPIYPSVIHSTPENFGRQNSQALVGLQMASAYVGTLIAPPIFGLIAEHISISLYPFFILVFAIALLLLTERVNSTVKA